MWLGIIFFDLKKKDKRFESVWEVMMLFFEEVGLRKIRVEGGVMVNIYNFRKVEVEVFLWVGG